MHNEARLRRTTRLLLNDGELLCAAAAGSAGVSTRTVKLIALPSLLVVFVPWFGFFSLAAAFVWFVVRQQVILVATDRETRLYRAGRLFASRPGSLIGTEDRLDHEAWDSLASLGTFRFMGHQFDLEGRKPSRWSPEASVDALSDKEPNGEPGCLGDQANRPDDHSLRSPIPKGLVVLTPVAATLLVIAIVAIG